MAPIIYEEDLLLFLPALMSGIPSMLLGIAAYVLTALALYTVAQRRGLNKPWLAWIPAVNGWILGSLSDQYQYIVKGENKSKRKVLLILNILTMVFSLTILVLFAVMAAGAAFAYSEAEMMSNIMGPAMAMLGLCVPLVGVSIGAMVIRYMAMYDIYRSMDPGNSVLFLVLSILISVTEPFFLFFNRNKDAGMPPRKQPEPAYIPSDEQPQESWEGENKDYL